MSLQGVTPSFEQHHISCISSFFFLRTATDPAVYSTSGTSRPMKFIKFLPDGTISEEILAKGVHYVDVALNEVPLFIRSGKCIPIAEVAECVKDIDTEHLKMLGYEGSSYTLYEDDGIHKDYDKEENYRILTK